MDAVRAAAERLRRYEAGDRGAYPGLDGGAGFAESHRAAQQLSDDRRLLAREYVARTAATPAEVMAAAERLQTGWRPIDGPTRDEDVGTLVRHVLAGRAADADEFDAEAFLARFAHDYRHYPNLRARTLADYADQLRAALGLAPREGDK